MWHPNFPLGETDVVSLFLVFGKPNLWHLAHRSYHHQHWPAWATGRTPRGSPTSSVKEEGGWWEMLRAHAWCQSVPPPFKGRERSCGCCRDLYDCPWVLVDGKLTRSQPCCQEKLIWIQIWITGGSMYFIILYSSEKPSNLTFPFL